jgi:type IV secretion system protein VirB11
VFSLDDYVAAGVMAKNQAASFRASVSERKNVRVVLIEDTRELQCAAPNLVSMRIKDRL